MIKQNKNSVAQDRRVESKHFSTPEKRKR